MQAVLDRMTPAMVYDPSLVLWLPLRQRDCRSGASFMSADAYGHVATVAGALWGSQGYSFDGVDDYVSIADNAPLSITDVLTVMAWVKPTSFAADSRILSKYNHAVGKRAYMLSLTGAGHNQLNISLGNSDGSYKGSAQATTVVTANNWYHCAGSFDGTYARVYLNGQQDAVSGALSAGIQDNDLPLYVGVYGDLSGDFTGQIDDVRIYHRTLFPAEIARIYEQTRGYYA